MGFGASALRACHARRHKGPDCIRAIAMDMDIAERLTWADPTVLGTLPATR